MFCTPPLLVGRIDCQKLWRQRMSANRPTPSDIPMLSPTSPAVKRLYDLDEYSPAFQKIENVSPISPAFVIRRKRVKRVVVSESETEDSGDDFRRSSLVRDQPIEYEIRALEFFNTSKLEELQELTGKCTYFTHNIIFMNLLGNRCHGGTSYEDYRC